MPTIPRERGRRFYFFSHEPNEPPHVHVDVGEKTVKVWLEPTALGKSSGFRSHDLNAILAIVRDRRLEFLERWHEYFGTGH